MATIRGFVRNSRGDGVGDVLLSFVNRDAGVTTHFRSLATGSYAADLSSGRYTVVVQEKGYNPTSENIDVPDSSTRDHNVLLTESTTSQSPVGSPVESPIAATPANGLLKMLEDPAFHIEADINEKETLEAIQLFARVNLVLGTKVRRQIGGQERDDILGIRSLYYGLRDNSLADTLVVMREANPTIRLWDIVEAELTTLHDDLEKYQSDFEFIAREAKRQFNLGTANTVLANIQFPSLFNRYVDIAADPRLSFNLRKEKDSELSDKTRVSEAINLLRELKEVVLQIVRSLSRYGTAATKRSNQIWGDLAEDALGVLQKVASRRAGDDQDELTTWATLSLLTGQNREVLFPYVTLVGPGTKLLLYAKELFDLSRGSKNGLEDFEEVTLLDLFQPADKEFYTTKLRREAYLIKRYPLPNWR